MKTDSEFWCALVLLTAFFALQLPSIIKAKTEIESAHRVATAVRIKGTPPQLDGVLDDAVWKPRRSTKVSVSAIPTKVNPLPNAPPSKLPT